MSLLSSLPRRRSPAAEQDPLGRRRFAQSFRTVLRCKTEMATVPRVAAMPSVRLAATTAVLAIRPASCPPSEPPGCPPVSHRVSHQCPTECPRRVCPPVLPPSVTPECPTSVPPTIVPPAVPPVSHRVPAASVPIESATESRTRVSHQRPTERPTERYLCHTVAGPLPCRRALAAMSPKSAPCFLSQAAG